MATWAVRSRGRSISRACRLFGVSETCYRYEPKLSGENERIADWLLRLTHNQRNWVSFIREMRQHCEKIAEGPRDYVARPWSSPHLNRT